MEVETERNVSERVPSSSGKPLDGGGVGISVGKENENTVSTQSVSFRDKVLGDR